jgi:hypothetical protein
MLWHGCSSSCYLFLLLRWYLEALKTIFAWCCDTRQCQDVILSNQCHQNEKMVIDDFDEFPLPEPPLVEDPFASLSATNLVAIEAATAMITTTVSMRMTTSDHLLHHRASSFPFLVS